MSEPKPNRMTIAAAAKRWGVTKPTVLRWINVGMVPATRETYGEIDYWLIPADAEKPQTRPKGWGEGQQ